MPELTTFKTAHFECVVWAKDVTASQLRLEKTLGARGKELPSSSIHFSPALQLTGADEPVSDIPCDGAVFFENKQYDIEFIFDDNLKSDFLYQPPRINHKLRKIEDAFHYSERSHSLRASINTGNDIGWFRVGLEYAIGPDTYKQAMTFEVLPTKMDMASDLDSINSDIDSQYPLWRFALAEKTHHQFSAVKKPQPQFLLLWLAQFESLRSSLEKGLKHIVNAPHSRLVDITRSVKADRLKGKLSPKLETKLRQTTCEGLSHKRFQVQKKQLSIDTPENRFIKSVIESCITGLTRINQLAAENDQAPGEQRLSDSFFNQLSAWQQPLKNLQRLPFFQEIGKFKGMSKESLVLQQKPGYARVYRSWQQLKWHLALLGEQSSLSLRNVAELYEVWCFLEIRNLILGLGFEEIVNKKATLLNRGLDVSMKDGLAGAFKFSREDGIQLRLAHEPIFKRNSKTIKTWSTPQQPDILLQATFPDGAEFIWLFDAKYRIDDEEKCDLVPDDAINQMHRYRDALIHQYKISHNNIEKTRPVFGAYALYPGFFNQKSDLNPYDESIEAIGIGAFSLLPGADGAGSHWLRLFLKGKLGPDRSKYDTADSSQYFLEEPARIPYRGLTSSRYAYLTITANQLGPGRSSDYIEKFERGTAEFYHMRLWASERQNIYDHIIKEARYLAVAVNISDSVREIRYVYPILLTEKLKRGTLSKAQTGTENIRDAEEYYWLFKLGMALTLQSPVVESHSKHFEMRLTDVNSLSEASKWDDLPQKYQKVLSEI